MSNNSKFVPLWALLTPFVCLVVLLGAFLIPSNAPLLASISAVALVFAVVAAVHHAEVVAHVVGEPYGTLILAIAVTIIEVGLVLMLMLAGGPNAATLARDTVFAAIMIVTNGILGGCLLFGGVRHNEQEFKIQGASSLLAVLCSLATLTLVLPSFTTTTAGPTYSKAQLLFAGLASLVLYGVFLFVQTVRHREYFLAIGDSSDEASHEPRTSTERRLLRIGLTLLLVSLVAVVGLAKVLAPFIETVVKSLGAPHTVVGVVIAMLVLLPETVAAMKAARANRLQTSLNLALGSGLASIALTIPAVAVLSVYLNLPLVLGIDSKSLVLASLTFIVGSLTLGTGRTTILQGAVHLVIFAAFLVLAFIP